MVWTQENYDALKEAIATGARKVKYGDKEVEYRTLSEMLGLLSTMAKDLGIDSGSAIKYPEHSKGFTT